MDLPTAHALLRDRRDWRGARSGLVVARAAGGPGDGDLVLDRVPGPADGRPVLLPVRQPPLRQASGIAVGPCDTLFVADTAHDRLLFVDGRCGGDRAWLPARPGPWAAAPGQFRTPRGLACADDALLVADSGNGRVQRLAWPALEPHLAWDAWAEPVTLAVDSRQRVLVVDAATATLHRVRRDGAPDLAFDAAVAASGPPQQPLFVAVDALDRVLVADVARDELVLFDPDGNFLHLLPGPPGWKPGAVATWGTRACVADAASGALLVFETGQMPPRCLGRVQGWQGPVTALATGADGTLVIKPGLDASYHRFSADAAFLPEGSVQAGPFDAGEGWEWERACIEADLPAATTLGCEVAVGATDAPPAAADWVALPAHDALLALCTTGGRRYAWLRLTLASTDPGATPRLRQARLATAAEDDLDHLPQTYRDHDQPPDQEAWRSGVPAARRPNGFLSRWLRLVRTGFGRIEQLLDDLPRLADPQFADPQALAWLAQWVGLELPLIADDAQRRALLARAVTLLARRGTPRSIADFVQLHTGIRPAIVEAASQRRIWMLDRSARLDFDTRLAPLDPLGMVVPDTTQWQGCCPASAPPADPLPASPCAQAPQPPAEPAPRMPIGRAVVGDAGPLAAWQIGLPLWAEEAWRFCLVVDAYRAADPETLREIARVVEREKPAHTDWRLELVAPELRVGLQARVGIDAIVGGEPPTLQLGAAQLSMTSALAPADTARVGSAALDGSLTLT